MNEIDPKELRAKLEALRKEFEDPRLTAAAAILGKGITWEAAKMENDQRLAEATVANDHTPLLPVPILDEVRSHLNANAAAAWIATARQIGEAWMRRQEDETGGTPSVHQIALYVEGELSNRNITGKRGKFLDRETIKREALTGITGRKRGENLRR